MFGFSRGYSRQINKLFSRGRLVMRLIRGDHLSAITLLCPTHSHDLARFRSTRMCVRGGGGEGGKGRGGGGEGGEGEHLSPMSLKNTAQHFKSSCASCVCQLTIIISADLVPVHSIFLTIKRIMDVLSSPPASSPSPPPTLLHSSPLPAHLAISLATLPGAGVVSGRGTSITSPSPIPNPILNFTYVSTGMRMWP